MIAQTVAPAAGAAAAGSATSGAAGGGFQLLFIAFMCAAFYFLMIAPQRKKQKEQEKMIASLQSGDEILTNSGIYGTITNVKDDRFVVRIADNTKIEIAKGFVQTVVNRVGEVKK